MREPDPEALTSTAPDYFRVEPSVHVSVAWSHRLAVRMPGSQPGDRSSSLRGTTLGWYRRKERHATHHYCCRPDCSATWRRRLLVQRSLSLTNRAIPARMATCIVSVAGTRHPVKVISRVRIPYGALRRIYVWVRTACVSRASDGM